MQITEGIRLLASLVYCSVSISYGFMPTSITTGDPGGLGPALRSAPPPVISALPVIPTLPVSVGIGVGWSIPASIFPMSNATRNAFIKAFSDVGPRILIPVNQPVERLLPLSSLTVIPAYLSDAMISVAIAMLSPSLEYVETVTECPAKTFKRLPIFLCWSRVSLRGATSTSSLCRSRFASATPFCASAMRASAVANFATASRTDALASATVASAVLMRAWSSAICLSYPFTDASANFARASASLAFCLAAATSPSAILCRLSAVSDNRLPYHHSPDTPPITNTANRIVQSHSALLFFSLVNIKWDIYSPKIPTATAMVDQPIAELYLANAAANSDLLMASFYPYYRKRSLDSLIGGLLALGIIIRLSRRWKQH